jgi:large subunit ribosomal protein L35
MVGSAVGRRGDIRPFCLFTPSEIDPMPKQKTHKGCKKRFRITARGKLKHRHAGTSHLNSRMTKKRRRNLRGTSVLDAMDATRVISVLAGNSY